MIRLIALLRGQSRLLLAVSMLAGIMAGVISSVVLAIVNESLENSGQGGPSLLLSFVGLAALATISKLVSRLVLMRLSTRTIRNLRQRLSEQIISAPLRDVEDNGASALMATLTDDVAKVAEALVSLPEQAANLAIATACFGYLFWLSWPLALGCMGIFAFGILLYQRVAKRAQPAMGRARDTWDVLIDHYSGLINGNKELKLHRARRTAFSHEGLSPALGAMMDHSWRWNWILSIAQANTQVVFFLLLGTIMFVAPGYAHFDKSVISGFLLMSLFMGGPIASIVGALPQFSQADVALRKIDSLGLSLSAAAHRDVDSMDATNVDVARPLPPMVELRSVTYEYTGQPGEPGFSLGPINLRVTPGEVLFVVGGNGSGKSSFAKLLTGLYVPASGTVLVDGKEVVDANRDDYRQNFTTVFSDYHLFRDLYGIRGAGPDEKAANYLESLQLSTKVSIADGRLSTLKLSQGQRKRLALLTAYLENRSVFVFDEWAADQDPIFKRIFYREILAELKARGKSVIVISHDNQYFDIADRVIEFSDGQLVDRTNIPGSRLEAPAEGVISA